MKYAANRPLADPETVIKKLIEIANAAEAVQDGRIHIELINQPFLRAGGTPAEYGAALRGVLDRGWLAMHHSGGYVAFTKEGADLFA
jgi:hypothetical protein